jgi:hypothetical protein
MSALLLLLTAAAYASPQCAACHRDQARSQPETEMAWALVLPESNRVLKQHPNLTVRKGIYSYAVATRGSESTYSVTDGKNTMSVPIKWAFGIHSQTWVLEYQGRLYESLVSYFARIDGLDTTIGDASIHPQTLQEALGRELSDFEAKSCFGCHATNALVHDRLSLDGLVAGVQCERCHTGAQAHAASISQGKTGNIPAKLGQRSPEEISNFCGQCHRTWERVVRDRLFGEVNVRFQPYRLANSKCYDGGDRRMSCISCHDPHRIVVNDARYYDSKCLACHSAAAVKAVAEKPSAPKICPVATGDCISCHMPKVELPGGHMVFTDHQIRIVRAGDSYPN